MYPGGTGFSVAEHVTPSVAPIRLKFTREFWESGCGLVGESVPLVQVTNTVTDIGLSSVKNFSTKKNVVVRTLTIVQKPEIPAGTCAPAAERLPNNSPVHVPVDT